MDAPQNAELKKDGPALALLQNARLYVETGFWQEMRNAN